MDNGHPDGQNPAFGHPVPGSMMASRAGVLVDPMPLPGQPASLRTGEYHRSTILLGVKGKMTISNHTHNGPYILKII